MLSDLRGWVVQKCWSWFHIDFWQQKSRLLILVVKVTFVMALVTLIGLIFAYIDIHVWSKQGSVILVPHEKIVEINGAQYIPIKILN